MVFPPGTLSRSFVMATCGFVSSTRSHIFFSCFCFCFCFCFFFHSLYSSANCAIKRANSGVRASGKQQQQNHKKKIVATRILGEKKS